MSGLSNIKNIKKYFDKDICKEYDFYTSIPIYYIETIVKFLTYYKDIEVDEEFKDIFINIFDKCIIFIDKRRDDLKKSILSVEDISWLAGRISMYPLIFQFTKDDLDLTKDNDYVPNCIINCIIKKDGFYHDWYIDGGETRLDCYISKGVLDGEYTEWYSNGNIKLEYNFYNGILQGECKQWYIDGKLKEVTTFLNDKVIGEYKSWWSNGNMLITCFYNEKGFHQDYKKYFKNGNLEFSCIYNNGIENGEYSWFYEDGSLKNKCFYKDGNIDGEYKWMDKEGNTTHLSYYIDGYMEGESKEWNSNGKLKEISVYKKGKRIRYQEWDENGYLTKSKV